MQHHSSKKQDSFIKDLLLATNLLLLNGGEGAFALTQSNLVNHSRRLLAAGACTVITL